METSGFLSFGFKDFFGLFKFLAIFNFKGFEGKWKFGLRGILAKHVLGAILKECLENVCLSIIG